LGGLAGGALWLPAPAAAGPGGKPLRGIFPIAQTPFTDAGDLDLDCLIAELRLIHRGGVHGFVWPQLASEWSVLSEAERLTAAEALASEARKLRPALVLGVQAPELDAALRYARQARRAGADAVISLPPAGPGDVRSLIAYYRAVAEAAELPVFVQAVGQMSVEAVAEIVRAVPGVRYVKDEAGQPLMRIARLREMTGGRVQVFSGAHGRTLMDEMERGFAGSMPAASFADLYAAAWDAWQAGKRREAMDTFSRAAMLIHAIGPYGLEALKYILCLRGVFRTWRTREAARGPARPGEDLAGLGARSRLDETAQRVLREMLEAAKPYLRA